MKPTGTSITTKKCRNGNGKGVFKGDWQSETMRSSKKPSGMSKTTESSKKTLITHSKKDNFQRRQKSCHTFFKVMGEPQSFKTSHMPGYHMEPIGDNEVFKGAFWNINNGQKGPKWQIGNFQRRQQS